MRKKTKIKTVIFSILAFIFGIILGAGTYAVAFTPTPDLLYSFASGDLSIHFMELGNKYAGDSIYIKANDNDILIDAGSRQSSATTISNYIDNYCTDGTLEYVFATHADQDHIAAFPKIFEKYEVKNVIDFGDATRKSTATLANYKKARDNEPNVRHAKASDYNSPDFLANIDNAVPSEKSIKLGSVTIKILYNYYQDHVSETSDENNYSVCLLITQGSNNILFTGDLEIDGETKLVANNNLPECVLFKAGHHGSKTSSNDVLLSKIKPQNVVFTCVAGSCEYTSNKDNMFPTQLAINRISKYTKNCYVTSVCTSTTPGDYSQFTSMNGDIIFSSNKDGTKITCTNNYTLLKDTDWFKNNRTWLGVA